MLSILTLSGVTVTTNGFISPTARICNLQFASEQHLCAVREASFGMGCFWQPAEDLLKVDGVVETIAGYTGQKASSPPSYDSVCYGRNDWVEGVRVRFDDEVICYSDLLDAFFKYQTPKYGSRQYSSVIFVHNEKQKEEAEEWKKKNRIRADGLPSSITSIEPLQDFYQAEEYHQKYWAKFRPRIAFVVVLIAISSGAADNFVPSAWLESLHTSSSGVALLGAIYVMLERKLQTKTVAI